jgi:hypothetical protein
MLRFRQVHLDFHTSEQIAGIGAALDPEDFADVLSRARVNSITCFARCHHGWIYYDTQLNPERRHPHMERDLLRRQIEACHAADIRVPIYITVQWDHYTANEHPEWLCRDAEGKPFGTPTFQAGFYRRLCVNSPYRDFLKAHTREVLETLPTDGIFFDIVGLVPCACGHCRAGMEAQGLDPAVEASRYAYGQAMLDDFMRDMTAFVRQFNADCTIFYNAGHIGTRHRPVVGAFSHWELESLPSGGWGYLHFPVAQRYARTLGLDCLGMTGKFHTSWGDFHSFKNLAALEYECFRMLALGAKCSIGDQLHPLGALDHDVYDLIGAVYSSVEQKEPWCQGARPLTDIAVLSPEEFLGDAGIRLPQATMGVERMLDEAGHQFDIIDTAGDFAAYKLLVLPDTIPVSEALKDKLDAYLAGGGALIASFESGLSPDKGGFALDALGVELASEGPRDDKGELVRGRHFPSGDYVEYLRPTDQAIGAGLRATEHAMYMRGLDVRAAGGAQTLADTVASYFDRTWRHFCSHRQTPSSGEARGPAIVRNGGAIYFAQPIFSQYAQNAPRWCKQLFLNAVNALLPEPLVRHSGPSTLFAALNEQESEGRSVLHLLHYIPERRGADFDVIEDVIPLHGLELSVRAEGVRRVVTAPEGAELPHRAEGGRVVFTLPVLNGHQMVALER